MIKKSIGTLRNAVKKRKELPRLIKAMINADDLLILHREDSDMRVSGHTESDAMNIVMLGTAIATSYKAATTNNPGLTFEEYLGQIQNIAIRRVGAA